MSLELVLPGSPDRVVPLPEGRRLTVGRMPQCDIHVDDSAVSRRHCVIQCSAHDAAVEDLGSANGTYINESPISSGRLRAGDVLRVGGTTFECRRAGQPQRRATAFIGGDDSRVESVIRRHIEPSQFEWLSSAAPAGRQLEMLRRAQRHLSTLQRVSELLVGVQEERQIGAPVLRMVVEVVSAERAAMVRSSDAGLEVTASFMGGSNLQPFAVSRTIVQDVIEKGVSTSAQDATTDERFRDGASVIGQHVRSMMCVPLRTADRILGALYVDSVSGAGRFSDADLELLAAVGNQVAVALHRVRLLRDLEKLLLDTLRAIAATVDARDGYTHRHSERVAAVARRLAREMGWPGDLQESAQLSALLHDVGKIAVPDAILNKPDRLSADEYEQIKQHPALGERILSNIESTQVSDLLPGIRHHHERWDGAGYPDGLSGPDIPLLGRVIAVADFFDALTSTRTYREPVSIDDALALIRNNAGTHFDPEVVAALERLHAAGELLALAER